MSAKLIPLWDCVLIERPTILNGLHLPDQGEHSTLQRGTIIAVGNSAKRLKVGDDVFFARKARALVVEAVHFEGKDYVIAPEEAVVAVVRDEATPESSKT